MITKVEVTNYRTCVKTTFEPHPQLSVLIGPNGSGKTNLLHAISLLKQLSNETRFAAGASEIPTVASRITAHFSVQSGPVRFVADVKTFTDDTNRDVIVDSRQRWYLPAIIGPRKALSIPLMAVRYSQTGVRQELLFAHDFHYTSRGAVTPFASVPRDAWSAMRSVARFLSHIQYYGASQFTNPASCAVSFEVEEGERFQRRVRPVAHSTFLGDLYAQHKRADNVGYKQFLELVGPKGLRLVDAIDFKEIPTSSINYSVQAGGRIGEQKRTKVLVVPQLRVGKQTLSLNQLSEGTFRTLTLIFYLTTQPSTLLLLEEPEVCIHHGLLSSILQVIKSHTKDKQVILSSHSELVLDEVEPENVFRVSFDRERGTQVSGIAKSLSRPALEALREYLRTEGNLGEYWRSGGLDA